MRRPARRGATWLGAALGLALGACGPAGGKAARPAPAEVPARVATAGDALLGFAPAGADSVLELDLARLRGNPAVGPLLAALAEAPAELVGATRLAALALLLAPKVDAVMFCSYGLGSDAAETLTLVRGEVPAEAAAGLRLDPRTVALGSEGLLARVRATAERGAPSLASEAELRRVRAAAMPQRASGAVARLAARLSFDARVSLAARLELDHVPESVSIWVDVADDLAIVALLWSKEPGEGKLLARGVERWRAGLLASRQVRALGLAGVVRLVRAEADGALARALLIVGPTRLAETAARLVGLLGDRAREVGP